MHSQFLRTLTLLSASALIAGCAKSDRAAADSTGATTSAAGAPARPCTGDSGGLTLPSGFCATVFADSLGHARHMAVAANGDVYVNTWSGRYYDRTPPSTGFVIALRDTNRDGRADQIGRFGGKSADGAKGGTGIALYDGYVYAEEGNRIVRYSLPSGGLPGDSAASGRYPHGFSAFSTIVGGLPTTGDHPIFPFVIDSAGTMYMNSGSATNSCQAKNRVAGSSGVNPCTELRTRAGIWSYDAKQTNQTFSAAGRFATGIRNAVGIALGPDGALYATQHGRDQLAENWSKLYTPEQGQNLPAEELLRVEKNDDFGWPMCYYDGEQQKLVLAPEYGGDGGKAVGDCGSKKPPVAAFPAHWAPDGLLFYTGSMFPARYRDGAFLAFHGSWNRAPGPQGGYQVVFQPLSSGRASGGYETFANGFAGPTLQPDAARYRPVGLAQGRDGALYVSDDKVGRIWRITYSGAR